MKRRSTLRANPAKVHAWQRKSRKQINPVNERRKEKRAEEAYGPGGGGGVYASLIRARPCDTCGAGRTLPRSAMVKHADGWTLDLDRIDQCAQSEPSHVVARGMGSVKGRWYDLISQCRECHSEVHASGWGDLYRKDGGGPALELAHALAHEATDCGLLPEGIDLPPRPARSSSEYRIECVELWRDRR